MGFYDRREVIIVCTAYIKDVSCHLFGRDITSGAVDEMRECHRMRYLSEPEIVFLLSAQDIEIPEASKFMTRTTLDRRTWNALTVGRETQCSTQ